MPDRLSILMRMRHFFAWVLAGPQEGRLRKARSRVRLAMLGFRRTALTSAHGQGVEADPVELAIQPSGFPFDGHSLTSAGSAWRAGMNQLLYRSMIALTALVLALLRSLRACSILCR